MKNKSNLNKILADKVAYHHEAILMFTWHFDLIFKKVKRKNRMDVIGLYVYLTRNITAKNKKSFQGTVSDLSRKTGLSIRRIRYAKKQLINLNILVEKRIRYVKTGEQTQMIYWFRHAMRQKTMERILKDEGYKLENQGGSKTDPLKNGKVGTSTLSKKGRIPPVKNGPYKYKGILINKNKKEKGILKNIRGVRRNSPHGYKLKPPSISDPRNPKNKKYRSLALKMMEVVIRDSKYTTIKPNEKEWTTAIRLFCERDSKSIKLGLKIIKTIIKYHDGANDYFLTTIFHPRDLKGDDKLQKIGNFMERVDQSPRKKNNSNRVQIESSVDYSKLKVVKI